ncbi:MAG TPA: (d)CMP kinase [Ktedonobacterales bacterium]
MGEKGHDAGSVQIAIDGAAGVGKSTIGARLAERLGYLYIDSGAFYRTLTLLALRQGIGTDDEAALLALIDRSPIRITHPTIADGRQYSVFAGDDAEDLAPSLHSLDVTRNVSAVARIPAVRAALIARMREMANAHNVVMVGRDIGRVVLPNATLKIALTAPADERARRRHADLVDALGDGAPALSQVLDDIEARDRKDAAQMELAVDAIAVENRDGQLDNAVQRISALLDDALRRRTPTGMPADAPALVATSAATVTSAATAASHASASRREGAYVAPKVSAPREHHWDGVAHPIGYRIVQRFAGLVFPLFFKLRVEGMENVPGTGGAMLASNHVAWIDIPLVAYPLARITHYMAKIELFQIPVLGWIIGFCGAFPVRRGEGDRESLRIADRLLGEGELVAIFPEGHRTGGALIRGLPGVALIALRANVPVVPVAIVNSAAVFRKGHILIRRPTVTVRYGAPFLLTKSGARHTKGDVERGIDDIMTHIAALLPAEYHGVYAEHIAAARQPSAIPASTGD